MYRIYIWSTETGRVKKKIEYQKLDLAKTRAIEHSLAPGVNQVSLCPIEPDGGPGKRIGVASYGEWADGNIAPHVPRHRRPGADPSIAPKRKKK